MKKLRSTLLVIIMATLCLVGYYAYTVISGKDVVSVNEAESENNSENAGENQPTTGSSENQTVVENQTTGNEESTSGNDENNQQPEDGKVTISLVAVGDNFAHDSVIDSGKQSDGSYNYDFLFENIKGYVESADIAAIFQTMIIAGNDKGVAGYPTFNTPEEMITAIDRAGFDVALMASNHTNDKGTAGITKCISLWKEKSDVLAVGINATKEEAAKIPIIEVKGKKIAILNYTTDMNNPIDDSDKQYMINNLGVMNTETGFISSTNLSQSVISDIKLANEQADFVVVFPYWGEEYNHSASSTQKSWAKTMTEAGADLIIGARSHYISGVEEITSDNGNKSLCYYSLGNFCSSFNYSDAMIGGMARVNIVFEGDNAYVDVEKSGMMPIITHYTHSGDADDEMAKIVGVYPISQYTVELASSHGIITRGKVSFSIDKINKVVNDNIKSQFLMKE